MSESDVFLTANEVASLLTVSRALAYRLLASGEIPSIRFNRTVRVKQSDLLEFIKEHSAPSAGTEAAGDRAQNDNGDPGPASVGQARMRAGNMPA
jgi:excisionase family DNA binding protein